MELNNLILTYTSDSFISSIIGYGLEVSIVILLWVLLKNNMSSISIFFEIVYEKAYDFFSNIVGEKEKGWIKTYVSSLFFIILMSNIMGVVLEIIAPIFGTDSEGKFNLEHYITIPSADINFNIALATISVIIILLVQFRSLGAGKFLYDYFPIYGKGYIKVEKGNKKAYLYYPLAFFIKIFDIIISMFLGVLDIIGLLAKIISLSFRLFGNMTSGTILLAMSVVGLSSITDNLFGFDFPILIPVLIYLQEILVAFIQALVFALLVSIFIRVASSSAEG